MTEIVTYNPEWIYQPSELKRLAQKAILYIFSPDFQVLPSTKTQTGVDFLISSFNPEDILYFALLVSRGLTAAITINDSGLMDGYERQAQLNDDRTLPGDDGLDDANENARNVYRLLLPFLNRQQEATNSSIYWGTQFRTTEVSNESVVLALDVQDERIIARFDLSARRFNPQGYALFENALTLIFNDLHSRINQTKKYQ
ncbi:hypothetical protein A3A46_02500 [Candidatus Roizmanbacteria bacterium RIFCSPLOWO2_01_FULL_37_13]|uniref:Uncharacterized protein n=1 Tax=Candidatus Roizmanbacteria bacterium RIFCSPHIGHO2_02_FULL_38_11 TaxID=1802039 RepID=A0A1F7H386_9BACT|nr:MAG: hypothetical protein A3C25_04065 [Candidatus Roizmanbacteria bacterium RIFCSPHIGHO2_02_FULL_38_11]OGK41443.1 MAG: hypothetical protein A3A46_02500 [Candidatus Roizmanbacteria bacterium RIFCSPLOWO2_01_FULL_37_13]